MVFSYVMFGEFLVDRVINFTDTLLSLCLLHYEL